MSVSSPSGNVPHKPKMDDDTTLFETIELFLNETKCPPGLPQACLLETHTARPSAPTPTLPPLLPAVTLPTHATPPPKERRKRHIEIQLLRDKIVQLESLRAVLAKRMKDAAANKAVPATRGLAKWKEIAVRELQRREQAMATNLELRKLVRGRSELARRVFKQVGHQQRLLSVEASRETTPSPSDAVAHMPAKVFQHEPIYNQLGQQTIELYERTLHAVSHPELPTPTSLVTRLRDIKQFQSGTGLFLDAIDARLVPFNLDATAHAVWLWLSSAHPQRQHHVMDVTVLDDHTALASMSATLEAWRCQGSVVVRRFDEPDRVVFVKAIVADQRPSESSDMKSSGHVVRHSEWVVLYRPVDDAQNVLPFCTEMVVRDVGEKDRENTTTDERLHGLAARHLTRYLDTMHEFVDNTLLNGSLGA